MATTAPAQLTGVPDENGRKVALRIVHIRRQGILTLDGKVVSVDELKRVAKTQNIYIQSDRDVTYIDAGNAIKKLSELPNHRVLLLTEDAKAAP